MCNLFGCCFLRCWSVGVEPYIGTTFPRVPSVVSFVSGLDGVPAPEPSSPKHSRDQLGAGLCLCHPWIRNVASVSPGVCICHFLGADRSYQLFVRHFFFSLKAHKNFMLWYPCLQEPIEFCWAACTLPSHRCITRRYEDTGVCLWSYTAGSCTCLTEFANGNEIN